MAKKRAKRKLSAILSADAKGYSRLMGEDELATVETLKTYRELMDKLIQKFNGRVVDSPGDNLLAEFASVVDAVESAVEIQKRLKARNAQLPENRRMAFRIGINLGDVIEDGERIYGDGVNVTARLEGLAEGGGICVSGTAYDHVKNKVPVRYRYLGEKSVKNIAEPVRAYLIDMEPADTAQEAGQVFDLPDKPSVAVLPFVNMSGDPEQDYFSDGLTEDIITDLSKISGLFVIARNSTFFYKGKSIKVKQVAEELGVRYVLEGSVRRAGDRVRITAQLVDAMTGGHLWAERYDREMKDLFALQDEVTHEIVSVMAVKLEEDEHKRLARKGTKNLEAYDYVLRGAEDLFRLSKEANAHARQMFEKSVELDPDYALPFSLLAWTYLIEWMLGWSQDRTSVDRALELAQKAISLDDSLPAAHWVLGNVYLWKKQHEEAIVELEKAIRMSPNNADCYATLGNVLTWAGRHEEAVEMVKKAMRLNPYYPAWYVFRLGQAYSFMGQYDEAIEALTTALNREPNMLPAHIFLAFVYDQSGQEEKARAQVDQIKASNPDYSRKVLQETFPLKDREQLEAVLLSLRKAGLK